MQRDVPTVVLALKLNSSGKVRGVRVIAGPNVLRTKAIRAAKKRRYEPGLVNGSPVAPELEVDAEFAPDTNEVTAIKPVMVAGVPSCIPAPSMVRISPSVMHMRLVRQVDPVYPAEAQAQNIEGVVTLRIHVDKAGNVIMVDNIAGPDALVPSAMQAVRQWKYQPTLINGAPIAVETRVEVNFTSPRNRP